MRAPRLRAPTAGASSAAAAAKPGQLPTAGVSSAVRRAFNAALHPRDGSGRFRQTDNPQQRPASRRRAGEKPKPRETVGQKALKTSGVTGDDAIEVLSTRVRKYKGFKTVESFVSSHPKGRAFALRTLAADQKAGRIGFSAGAGAARAIPGAAKDTPAPSKPPILAEDRTTAGFIPPAGTPEREFHDDMLRAASTFGDRAKMDVSYGEDGKPYAVGVDVYNKAGDEEVGTISRVFGADPDGTKYVKHSLFMLDDANQGAGQAKEFLARSMQAYKHLGIEKVKLHANIDVGGYAWLKYGFRPDREGVAALTKHTTARVEALHKAGAIDDVTRAHLTRSIGFEDFSAMIDIGGSKKVGFEGKTQTLGKHLFLGSDWTGELDLNSRTAMQQFNGYIGGKQ